MKTKFYFSGKGSLIAVLASATISFSGCSVIPDYSRPQVQVPLAFKEAVHDSNYLESKKWKVAQPSDHLERGKWWEVFDDTLLNKLQETALANNQDLIAAVARLEQARAINAGTKASSFPTITLNGEASREKESPASKEVSSDTKISPKTLLGFKTEISYEPDLFGRVKASKNGSKARLEESEAMLKGVQLSLSSDVAQSYFNIRGFDSELTLFKKVIEIRERSLKIAQQRYANGDISLFEVSRAKAELVMTQSEALAVKKDRAIEEHRLAILLGNPPADFLLPMMPLSMKPVVIPIGVPSTLLERRPDIASAERKMAAANADVGLAKTAFYPSIKLGLSGGFEASSLSDIFNWSSRTFLLGPVGGTILSLPIFDGGQLSAKLEHERWVYEEQVASYRQTVLKAFQEVEDVASNLKIIDQQIDRLNVAVDSSSMALKIANIQYSEGEISYLDVLDTERSALQSKRNRTQLETAQAIATVKLIQSLGGYW